jgi:hypothetical protein
MTACSTDYAAPHTARSDLVQLEILLRLAVEKLSAGFFGAHEALRRQQAMGGSPDCAALATEACAHLDNALTALQFEDIACQLIASARRQLPQGEGDFYAGRNLSVTQHHMESGEVELF